MILFGNIKSIVKTHYKRFVLFGTFSLLFFFADFFIKIGILRFIDKDSELVLFQKFNLQLSICPAINYGAAWGLFASFPKMLMLVRCITVIGLICFIIFSKTALEKLLLFCICVGALANIFDVFLYGFVIDFIKISYLSYCFPIFNPADILVSLGAVGFTCCSLKKKNYFTKTT